MPACDDRELLLGGLVDGELDAANTALIEAHVARCEGCREELERLQAVQNLLRSDGVRHAAPESLSRRIAALPELAASPASNDNRLLRWFGPGVIGALAASLAMVTFIPPGADSVVDQELVSSHVRSLQPGHLTDVQTTNQHIVKPWFNGRIDFSPPVPERRLHTVNLFVWPARDAAERSFVKDGFAVKEWSRNGLRFAAISDIPPTELQQFHKLFEARST